MNVEVERLRPGMILIQDVIGKSGEPIMRQGTTLTDMHITFLRKFLIKRVAVTTDGALLRKKEKTRERVVTKTSSLSVLFSEAEKAFEKMFHTWRNNVAIDMYDIRKTFIPFLTKASEFPLQKILFLYNLEERNNIFQRTLVQSVLSVQLAKLKGFAKKDWLQIGFAALLSDSGLARLTTKDFSIETYKKHDKWQLHPLYSYQMVENITTLTKISKIAILQHHEYLDGSGFPGKISSDQISSYSRIVSLIDFLLSLKTDNIRTMILELNEHKGKKLDHELVSLLIEQLEVIENK